MARTQTEALKVAKSWVGRSYGHGWCQMWVVREVFGTGGVGDWDGDRAADAEDGWKAAKKKVATTDPYSVPAGLPIYFLGGSSDHGHAAVSAGGGNMYSTDRPVVGQVGLVPIKSVEKAWGVRFVGYVTTDGNGHNLLDATAPKPVPVIETQKTTVLVINAASRNAAVDKALGTWGAKRAAKAASFITARGADFVCVQELYFEKRSALTSRLPQYEVDGVRGGRVILRRKASAVAPVAGSIWTDLLPGTGTKYAVARKYKFASGAILNLANAHLSWETTASGIRKRALEAPAFIAWIRGKFPTGYDAYFADFNSPYEATTRADGVGSIFESHGLHDFGDDVDVKSGKGFYHLIRGFGGRIKATSITIHPNDFTDHSAIRFTISIPIK